jgi:hypothetical protein
MEDDSITAGGDPAIRSLIPNRLMPGIYLLNTTVVPCEGLWDVQKTTLSYATYLAGLKDDFTSAVGHDSTAALLSTLLGTTIPVNRISVAPKEGDLLLCFKLKQRAPEGKILSVEELEALGYEFFLMELISPSKRHFMAKVSAGAVESELWRSRSKPTQSREFLGGHRD